MAEEKLKKALAKRQYFITEIESIDKKVNNAETFMQWSEIELDEYLKQITSSKARFTEACMQLQMDNDIDADRLQTIATENEQMRDSCLRLKVKLRSRIDALAASTSKTDAQMQAQPNAKTMQCQANAGIMQADEKADDASPIKKRQKQDFTNLIGKFNGTPIEWQQFSSKFQDAVGKSIEIDAEEKLKILVDACAKELGIFVATSCENFDAAWKKLSEMFGGAYKQTRALIQKFIAIPTIQMPTSDALFELEAKANKLRDQISEHMQNEASDTMLALMLIEKLDKQTKRIWERHRVGLAAIWAEEAEASKEPRKPCDYLPDFESVVTLIREEAEYNATYSQSKCGSSEEKSTYANVAKTPTAHIPSQQALDEAKVTCTLCKDGSIHALTRCPTIRSNDMPIDMKWAYVRENNRCPKCLHPNHEGACRDKRCNEPCPNCHPNVVYHNSILCANRGKQAYSNKSYGQRSSSKNWNDDEWKC